jgi:serine/threonine protein kinase
MCQACGSKLLLKERYRAIKPIGQGEFGRTFLAIDEDIPSKPACVIKQLHLQTRSTHAHHKATELFYQEAVRLDELGKHDQIPSLLAHLEQNRLLYLVQEFVDGQTLTEQLAQQGAFQESQIWHLLRDLLPILKFVHDRQVIHRDIKPANIMQRQHDRKLVLIDFGIAKLVTASTTAKTGTIVGSPEYMAPEQTRGKALPASDLYSVGVVCVRLLTNVSPFDLFDSTNDRWAWRDFLPNDQTVSSDLGNILDTLLQNAISQRFQSAEAVLQALAQSPVASQSLRSLPLRSLPATATLVTPKQSVLTTLPISPASETEFEITEFAIAQTDYKSLKALLAAQHWQQADTLTWILIRRMLEKLDNSYVFSGELNALPCADLRRMDEFWKVYSRDRFGFRVQARIYHAVEEDYGAFCDRVGWQRDNNFDSPKRLTFRASAPAGHLPSRLHIAGQQWWRHVAVMTAKLAACSQHSILEARSRNFGVRVNPGFLGDK